MANIKIYHTGFTWIDDGIDIVIHERKKNPDKFYGMGTDTIAIIKYERVKDGKGKIIHLLKGEMAYITSEGATVETIR